MGILQWLSGRTTTDMVSFAVRPTNGAAACNRLVQAAARSSLRGGSASERLFPVQKTGPMLTREQARHRPKVSSVAWTRKSLQPSPTIIGCGTTHTQVLRPHSRAQADGPSN